MLRQYRRSRRAHVDRVANMPDHPADAVPPAQTDRALVIKSGAGLDDAERCVQAFTVAATAVTMGASVSMWLMGEAVHLAVPGVAATLDLPGAPSLADLLETVLTGGSLTVCTQCAARRGLTPDDFVAGTRVAGAATYVEEVLAEGAQALIY